MPPLLREDREPMGEWPLTGACCNSTSVPTIKLGGEARSISGCLRAVESSRP